MKKEFKLKNATYSHIYIYVGELCNAIPTKAPNRMGDQWGVSLGSTFIPVMGGTEDRFSLTLLETGALKVYKDEGGGNVLFAPKSMIEGIDPNWEFGGWAAFAITDAVVYVIEKIVRARKTETKEKEIETKETIEG